MTYEINYSDGRPAVGVDTYEQAIAAIETEWPESVTDHAGDLTDGGDRTLCWPDEDAAGPEGLGDDGARAVAEITRA